MPAIQRIIPAQSKEFWDALDPENMKQVLEAVKDEVKPTSGSKYKTNICSKLVR
jgi:hypothetical protein